MEASPLFHNAEGDVGSLGQDQDLRDELYALLSPFSLTQTLEPGEHFSSVREVERDPLPTQEPAGEPSGAVEPECPPQQAIELHQELPQAIQPQEGDSATDRSPKFGPKGLSTTAIHSDPMQANILQTPVSTAMYKKFVKTDNGILSCGHPDCDDPKAVYSTLWNLERHIRSRHTNESSAYCEGCGRHFTRQDNQRTHKCPKAAPKSTTASRRRKRRQRH